MISAAQIRSDKNTRQTENNVFVYLSAFLACAALINEAVFAPRNANAVRIARFSRKTSAAAFLLPKYDYSR